MFIKNLKSGVVTEINNEDVIKHCKGLPEEYEVFGDTKEVVKEAPKKSVPAPVKEKVEENLEENSEEASEKEAAADVEETQAASENFSSMNVAELRKVAKSKGIQGYANMNKETLVAVIEAHE